MPLHDFLTPLPQHLASHPIRTLVALPPLLLLVYILVNEVARYRARVPGMRGPPGFPLIGNLASIRTNAAATYKDWARTYGDVYQVQMGNVPIVVVNSARAARALWVGQSQALSSRPVTYTFHKVSGSSSLLLEGGGGDNVGLTRDVGGFLNTGPHDRYLALRRVPQAAQEGRRRGPQQACPCQLCTLPGRRVPDFCARP